MPLPAPVTIATFPARSPELTDVMLVRHRHEWERAPARASVGGHVGSVAEARDRSTGSRERQVVDRVADAHEDPMLAAVAAAKDPPGALPAGADRACDPDGSAGRRDA